MNATRFSKTPLGRALLQVAGLRRRPVVLLKGLMRNLRELRPHRSSALASVEKLRRKSRRADPLVRKTLRPPLPITPTAPAHIASRPGGEHQTETEFLRHCLHYGNKPEHLTLGDRIGDIQRDVSCVQRAVGLMAVLTALAATILGYVMLLGANIPQDTSQLIVNGISALGLASVISLVAFAGLTVVFRMKLDQHREEGRQLVAKLLAFRLGKPAPAPWSESRVASGNGGPIQAAGGDGSPRQAASTSRG